MLLRLKRNTDRALEAILVVLMSVLVIDVVWQVFTRFVLQDASSLTEELARYLMIWVGLLGAAYVAGQNQHLAVDLLPRALKGARRRRLGVVIDLCILLFAVVVLLIGGARLVYVTLYLGQTSAALGVSLGFIYLAIPISGLLMAFYASVNLVHPAPDAETLGGGAGDAETLRGGSRDAETLRGGSRDAETLGRAARDAQEPAADTPGGG